MAMIKVRINNMALIAVIINIAYFVPPTFEHKIEVVSNNINVMCYIKFRVTILFVIIAFFHHAIQTIWNV